MTEPDPTTALAAQLEELRGQLAHYTGETGRLPAWLEADSGQVLMLRHEIKKPGQKITAVIASREADQPPAPYWTGLSREELAAQSGELRAWADRVARVQWPGYTDRIAPCWPDHPEAAREPGLTGPDAIAPVSPPPRVPAPQDQRAGGQPGREVSR